MLIYLHDIIYVNSTWLRNASDECYIYKLALKFTVLT